MSLSKEQAPAGVGVGWRFQLAPLLFKHPSLVDFVEVSSRMYTMDVYRNVDDPGWRLLQQAAKSFPLMAHGPSFSIGSAEMPDKLVLENVKKMVRHFPIRTFSEHLCFMQLGEQNSHSFITLPFNDQSVETVVKNIKYIQSHLGIPFLIENITQYFTFSSGTMTEAEFISRVAEEADCGILLDVANLFINAQNHNYNPYDFIDALPGDRVLQSHFCGATYSPNENYFYDTHAQATLPPIWDLLEYALNKTDLNALVYERDSRFLNHNEIIGDLWHAKELYFKYRKPVDKLVPFKRPTMIDDSPKLKYDKQFHDMQAIFLRLLIDPVFAAEYDRGGASILSEYKLDEYSIDCIASVNVQQRKKLAGYVDRKSGFPEMSALDDSVMPNTYIAETV